MIALCRFTLHGWYHLIQYMSKQVIDQLYTDCDWWWAIESCAPAPVIRRSRRSTIMSDRRRTHTYPIPLFAASAISLYIADFPGARMAQIRNLSNPFVPHLLLFLRPARWEVHGGGQNTSQRNDTINFSRRAAVAASCPSCVYHQTTVLMCVESNLNGRRCSPSKASAC